MSPARSSTDCMSLTSPVRSRQSRSWSKRTNPYPLLSFKRRSMIAKPPLRHFAVSDGFGQFSQGSMICRDMLTGLSPPQIPDTKATSRRLDSSLGTPGAVTNAQTDRGSTRHSAHRGVSPDRNTPKIGVSKTGNFGDLWRSSIRTALCHTLAPSAKNRGGLFFVVEDQTPPRGCAPS